MKKEEQKMKKRMPALRLGTPMETSFVMGVKVSGQVAMIWLTQLLLSLVQFSVVFIVQSYPENTRAQLPKHSWKYVWAAGKNTVTEYVLTL